MLTKQNKDVDREILLKIKTDKSLLAACQVDKYTFELCNNDFFRKRLNINYPVAYKIKPEDLTWKKYYLMIVYYKNKAKIRYNIDFMDGDFKYYYNSLTFSYAPLTSNLYHVAEKAVKIRDLKTIEYLIDINDFDNMKFNNLLDIAVKYSNNIDIIKYLIQEGATKHNKPLLYAAKYGYLELLEYIIEISITEFNEYIYNNALAYSLDYNNLNITKYLVDNNLATEIKYVTMEIQNPETVKYLKNKGLI